MVKEATLKSRRFSLFVSYPLSVHVYIYLHTHTHPFHSHPQLPEYFKTQLAFLKKKEEGIISKPLLLFFEIIFEAQLDPVRT